MIKFEKAIQIIKANNILMGTERVDLKESLNRVLCEDVFSDLNMPPFNKSAMDGYACRREDIANELEVIETIPAGYNPLKSIGKNQCAKIMTGAMMPEGADCVIIVEDVEAISETKIKFKGKGTADNICLKGEDVLVGTKLLSAGTRITAKEIASLALTGCVNPLVSIKPTVGIIATGDEIIEPYLIPQESQIRNTNSYQILAQCEQFGCQPNYYGIVKDKEEAISGMISKVKEENNLIIITGGVSMGEFDLVPGLLKKNGFEILFDKVAIQPGRPTVFGRYENKFVFGLPGNPVSSFIVFEIFIKEFLTGLMGLNNHLKIIKSQLAKNVKRKRNVRHAWIPIRINSDGKAEAVEYHGSAHINSLAYADGIMSIPIGINEIKEGTIVDVRQI